MLLDEVSAAGTLPKSLQGWIHGVFSKEYGEWIRYLRLYKIIKSMLLPCEAQFNAREKKFVCGHPE